jgi:hypothetical protein
LQTQEIFNINKNETFIKRRKREEISSDEDSIDREADFNDMVKDALRLANKPITQFGHARKYKSKQAKWKSGNWDGRDH